MNQKGMFVAKTLVAVDLGALFGNFVGHNSAADAEKARTLTMDAYVEDYAKYKAKLESHVPLAGTVIVMVIFSVGVFGLYEFSSMLVARLLTATIGRSRVDPETSPQ
jgi:hypothetical protein